MLSFSAVDTSLSQSQKKVEELTEKVNGMDTGIVLCVHAVLLTQTHR